MEQHFQQATTVYSNLFHYSRSNSNFEFLNFIILTMKSHLIYPSFFSFFMLISILFSTAISSFTRFLIVHPFLPTPPTPPFLPFLSPVQPVLILHLISFLSLFLLEKYLGCSLFQQQLPPTLLEWETRLSLSCPILFPGLE